MRKKNDAAGKGIKSGDGKISRRQVLKGAGAVAGVAAGSGAITGFPTIWAQEIKDIELRHVGVSYSVVKAIGDQASADLGFKVTMQNLDTSAAINRFITQPNTVDIPDLEGWQAKLATRRGVLQGIEVAKVKEFDNFLPIFTKGEFEGNVVSRQGISPYEAMYIESKDATDIHEGVTEWATFLPQVYNADTLGIRPDLVGREITSWADLISPDFKGKAAIQNIPTNGIMDAMMALEAAGEIKYVDKGNPTQDELSFTIARLIELKKGGHWRALWNTFDESVNLMAAGEVTIQSMWSPAVTAVKSQGVQCVYQPLKEGYRGWGNGLALMSHVDGVKRDAAYEYLNWYNSGWVGGFIAKQGYYSANVKTAMAALTENERGFFYEGKPATADITSPTGEKTNSAGEVRDGGSYEERFSQVAVWNNLMDEAEFLFAKWNEFNAA
jgi:putative spermidine/putrescine transport system substrate-binding protein